MKRKCKEKTWADYALKNFSSATRADLQAAVRKAAKAANQRLLRLERADKTTGAYQIAQRYFKDTGHRRYKERTGKMTYNELQKEYKALRSFISAKSSTIQGANEIAYKRYQAAVFKGYGGTFSQFELDVRKAFTKIIEGMFSSDVIYEALTGGNLDILDETVKQFKDSNEMRGKALLTYMKRKKKSTKSTKKTTRKQKKKR